jgi:hypothetical protein
MQPTAGGWQLAGSERSRLLRRVIPSAASGVPGSPRAMKKLAVC